MQVPRCSTARDRQLPVEGHGDDVDVASAVVDEEPPPPPQAATPALRNATAARRVRDVLFNASGILFLSDEISLLARLRREDSVVVVQPAARQEDPTVDAGVGRNARDTAVTMGVVVDADPVPAHVDGPVDRILPVDRPHEVDRR